MVGAASALATYSLVCSSKFCGAESTTSVRLLVSEEDDDPPASSLENLSVCLWNDGTIFCVPARDRATSPPPSTSFPPPPPVLRLSGRPAEGIGLRPPRRPDAEKPSETAAADAEAEAVAENATPVKSRAAARRTHAHRDLIL